MPAIATAGAVDRRTVYRRFATREALTAAVHIAKLDAAEELVARARLNESVTCASTDVGPA
ncbi:hypothetical protein AB0945_38615 [Streptomyces sp. NPDC005474]|uniref:hypothetical protein n=1 Tax=Streptomyces sp. NPDC005474 TaxID=3154878 RepID=UPI0034543C6B